MAVVTSIINLKGGVGKTTLTLALAHYLAAEHAKRVLVIDLDPQTNATIALVTERRWRERDQTGQTLFQLFKECLAGLISLAPATLGDKSDGRIGLRVEIDHQNTLGMFGCQIVSQSQRQGCFTDA